MIDIIVNDRTGAYGCHDEREMDRGERLEICSRSGVASLLLPGGTCRRLGSLAPTLVSALKEKMPEVAMLVRMSGWSIARTTRIDLRFVGSRRRGSADETHPDAHITLCGRTRKRQSRHDNEHIARAWSKRHPN